MIRTFLGSKLVVILAGCATSPVPAEKVKTAPSDRLHGFQEIPSGEFGTMVVTRDSGFTGSACYIVLKLDGEKTASFGTSETATFFLEPGEKLAEMSTGICGAAERGREVVITAGQARRYRIALDIATGYSLMRTNH